jgi:hypothetical protein
MSKNNGHRNRSIASAFAVAIAFALLCQAGANIVAHFVGQTEHSAVMIADKQVPSDPGKDITDDPHGPGTHGPDPHGGDGHDEIHDAKLPANDPDSYFPKQK